MDPPAMAPNDRNPALRACVLLGLCLCLCLPTPCAAEHPIVQTAAGQLEGRQTLAKTSQFLGIPYAEPPVGALRWQSPQPHKPWAGVRSAEFRGNPCLQPWDAFFYTIPSEDCLFLNVFVPVGVNFSAPQATGGYPVLLFVHGGSYVHGAGSLPTYDGDAFALYQDVVVVTINYRLGVLGFGGSELLRPHNPDGSVGNYGFQDQRLAMQWVADNIHAFGGDPSRVFLFGESAGAGSVSAHLVANRSVGLFAAAGMESGPEVVWAAVPLPKASLLFDEFVNLTSCAGTGPGDDALLDCLLAMPPKDIEAAQEALAQASPHAAVAPVIDGVEFTEHPVNLARRGAFASKVPVLLGCNHDEGTMFTPDQNATADQVAAYFNATYGPDWGPRLLAQYPFADYPSPWWAVAAADGDKSFACPTRRTARWLDTAGIPAFSYFFNHVPIASPVGDCYGVCHTAELSFVFHYFLFLRSDAERELSLTMNGLWASFARDGVPSGQGLPAWPRYNTTEDAVLQLGAGADLRVISHLWSARCDTWDAYLAAHPLPDL